MTGGTTTFYIARHGNTFNAGDIVRRVGRRTDLALSQSGKAQAARLAEHFKADGIVFDQIIASPLRRARETAEAILRNQDPEPHFETNDALLEIDYGPDENQPEDAVRARIGEDALARWEQESTPPPGWIIDADAVRARWRSLMGDIAARPGVETALLVTSAGVARFLFEIAEEAPLEATRKLRTGAYGVATLDNGRLAINTWNLRPPA
ncbi:MAG: histidine phosphatase family protein [Pseudomonadota bacterium]